jgi:hypothetical protein
MINPLGSKYNGEACSANVDKYMGSNFQGSPSYFVPALTVNKLNCGVKTLEEGRIRLERRLPSPINSAPSIVETRIFCARTLDDWKDDIIPETEYKKFVNILDPTAV